MIIVALFGIFLCGMVVANNLGCLVEVNPEYHAAWWKIWAFLAIAVFYSIVIYLSDKEGNR